MDNQPTDILRQHLSADSEIISLKCVDWVAIAGNDFVDVTAIVMGESCEQ